MKRVRLPLALLGLALLTVAARGSYQAVYTAVQAEQGHKVYMQNCAMCHGLKLQGAVGPALRGRKFRLMASNQNLTANTLRLFVARHMPAYAPASLKPAQYDEVTAYILKENGFPAGRTKLTPHSAKAKRLYLAAFPRG
jgi:mono/diheme cytochrome c family protein